MTDRELLELAARAAELESFHFTDNGNPEYMADEDWQSWCPWNPLTSDGDALRLAVKLGMLVEVVSCAYVNAMNDSIHVNEHTGNDLSGCIYAATRRAIVRAAAAIGEGMV